MALELADNLYLDLDPSAKQSIFCYKAIMTTSAGVWLGDNPLHFSLPLLLYQLTIIFIFSRITHSVLRHLSQPQVISQIIAGMILGPSVMGRSLEFEKLLFTPKSWEQLNAVSILAFTLFLFIVGVKTDLGMIRKTGKKAVAIALVGTILPFLLVILTAYLLRHYIPPPLHEQNLILTVASRWSMTSYTVLSCTLSELNLLSSKLGRLAMSASLIADFCNLILASGFSAYMVGASQGSLVLSVTTFIAFVVFMAFLMFVARPLALWIIRKTPEGNLLDEASFVGVIFLALGCGLISEVIGFHATMGPFFLGLILPGGAPLGVTMVERMERLVVGVFLPVFLAQAGLRMDLAALTDTEAWGFMELFVVVCVVGKFVGAAGVCLYCKMPLRDALSLGLIMICKGILEVDGANSWQDAQLISRPIYTIFILSIILFGGCTAPLIKYIYRPEDRFVAYKRRTIQHLKRNSELRIIACIHSQENVNPIITLLDASFHSADSPICVYVLHLIQLVGRAAAVLAPHKRQKGSSSSTTATESDRIVNAFHYFEQQNPGCLSVLPYICISPYATMHDDICSLTLDKKASLVIVPFHKQLAIDGTSESVNPAIQAVNINVLHYAPCSVGILIYHGLPGGTLLSTTAGGCQLLHQIAVYFFGGADDREALAYGMRMAEDPSIGLTVVRFCLPKEWRERGREERLDDEIVEEFRASRIDESRMVYREEVVKDGEGTVGVIRAISNHFSLLIVGRRDGKESSLTAGLSVWNEYPELGIIGDLLASTDFGGRVSTLVVQQQTRVGVGGQCESPRNLHTGQVIPHDDDDDD